MTLDPGRVQALFLAALERDDPADRAALLGRECAGDLKLRRRVEALLLAHDQPDSLLDQPFIAPGVHALIGADADAADTVDLNISADGEPAPGTNGVNPPPRTISEGPGSRIGHYKLLQLIGEGGMGSVYMAEQEQPVRRRVALKIIKPGMDSAQVIARFEAERQALAMMDHQSIARVLDAGATAAGRPYFVMELVHGIPITQYCDEAQLTPTERLELFIPVCQAIQHAHQKGIIHRDIKPSNVLVTLYDGKAVPKVIDFGIAKAIDQRLTERTMFTEFGSIVGTLEYMSPEQAEMSAIGVDTRSDIYSLGVLLYELMTGSTPLERARLHEAGYVEILRRIKEEETPRPSNRLSASGDALASISARRKTEARQLSRLMRGELDWIVMKALEKDRGRRYETASSFARDVQNYLLGDPVEACPPSASYRLQKFAGKHRKALLVVSALTASLLLGAIVSIWQAIRATQNEARATLEANRALAAEARSNRERDRAVKAEAEAKLEGDKAKESAAEAEAVLGFFQDQVLAVARPEGQLGGLGKDVTIRSAIDAAEPKIARAFADQPKLEASIRDVLGQTYGYLGEAKLELRQHERTLELRRSSLGADHRDTLESMNSLANAYRATGRLVDAIRLFEQTVAAMTAKLGPADPATLATQDNLAEAYYSSGQLDRAIGLHERSLAGMIARLGPDHPHTFITQNNLAVAYRAAGKLEQALALYEKTLLAQEPKLGPDHPDTLKTRNNLAVAYEAAGKVDKAIALLEQGLSTATAKLGPDHPSTLKTESNLASSYRGAGRLDKAIALYEKNLEARLAKFGPDHPDTFLSQHNLAVGYADSGRIDEAIPLYERSFQGRIAKLGPDHRDTLNTEINLASAYERRGDYDRAEPLLRALLDIRKKKLGEDHLDVAQSLSSLGQNLLMQRKWVEAEPLLRQALAIRSNKATDEWYRFNTESQLGGSLLGQEKYTEAEAFVLSGYEGLKAREAKIPPAIKVHLTRAGERVIRLYESTGRQKQADEWRTRLNPPANVSERKP
jgi:serine/threonine protein kinase/tetratricopeptide (TPR) repeat protein